MWNEKTMFASIYQNTSDLHFMLLPEIQVFQRSTANNDNDKACLLDRNTRTIKDKNTTSREGRNTGHK